MTFEIAVHVNGDWCNALISGALLERLTREGTLRFSGDGTGPAYEEWPNLLIYYADDWPEGLIYEGSG